MEELSFGVRKGAWTEEEDLLLKKCIEIHGEGKWHRIPSKAGLNRCRKSCRLRWLNYLKPNIKRGGFGDDEVDLIIRLHRLLGNRWSLIAGRLPGRTANSVKNYWNTHLLKKSNLSNKDLKPKVHNPHSENPPNPDSNCNIVTSNNIVIKPRPWTLQKKSFVQFDHPRNNNEYNHNNNNNNNNNLATRSNNWLAEGDSNQERNYCIPSDNIDEILWWENLLMNDDEVDDDRQLQDGAAGCFNYGSNNPSGMGDHEKFKGVDTEEILGERGIGKVVEEGTKSCWDQLFRDVELWNVFNPEPDSYV